VIENNRQSVVLDGQRQKDYDGILAGMMGFSPNGKWLAYAARAGEGRVVVIAGRESRAYEAVGGLTFSPDGRRFAYRAQTGNVANAIVDGVRSRDYAGVGGIAFSDGEGEGGVGRHVAFPAERDGATILVVDGAEAPGKYDALLRGTRLVFDGPNSVLALMRRERVVVRVRATVGADSPRR
jgi:hypothetical protein